MTRKPRKIDPAYPRAVEDREVKRIGELLSADYNRVWNVLAQESFGSTTDEHKREALERCDMMVEIVTERLKDKKHGHVARAELRKYLKMWKQSRENLLVKILLGTQ